MMKTYKYLALAAMVLGFAACTQEEDFTPQGNQKGAPIAIASVGTTDLATRATITTEDGKDYLTGGKIGVSTQGYGEYGDSYWGDNIPWEYVDGKWRVVSGHPVILFAGSGSGQAAAAYYPYSEDYIVELPTQYDENYEDWDYLYTADEDIVNVNTNPISLTLSHLFTKVTVSVSSLGSSIVDDEVTAISLIDVPRKGERSLATGKMTTGGNDYGESNQSIGLYNNGIAYVGYAFPNKATTLDIKVTMKSNRTFKASVNLDDATTPDVVEGMTEGVHYQIGLKVGKDKVSLSSVNVVGWDMKEIEGGVAEDATLTIDGTFGGKTEVTEDDIDALTETIKRYIDNGGSTVIVTGSDMAMDGEYAAYSEALFNVGEIEKYFGSVDLILPDATELGEYELDMPTFKSITLPKVTTIGAYAFASCRYVETLTFGFVVESVGDQPFYELGIEVDGEVDLVLNKDQVNVEGLAPDLTDNTWAGHIWKSITLK